jgi:hypothetical protein
MPTLIDAGKRNRKQPRTTSTSSLSWASATPEKRKVSGHARRWNNRTHKLNCGNLLPLVDNRGFSTRVRSAFSSLSTFPQPHPSTTSRRLTSVFTRNIHRTIHRTLAWQPPGLA